MKLPKLHILEILSIPAIFLTYFATRLYSIMSLPIFTDEAIYVRWAQIANYDSAWRFISLTDGKQPSFIWLEMVMQRIIEDPLLAGRMVSVFAGFAAIVGVFFVSYEIFRHFDDTKRRIIAIISSFLGVILPISLVYDRLAIYESLTAAFFIWALYFQLRLVRVIRFDHAMVLGFVLGGAVLTKSIGFLSIYLSPFLILLFDFDKKDFKKRLTKTAIYFIVATFMAYVFYSVLRLSPHFHMISQKNTVFIYTFYDWFNFTIQQRFELFISNSKGLFDWFIRYFTFPFIGLVIASFFFDLKTSKEKIVLLLWFLLPILSLCFLGRTLYPRYIYFMVIPLLPLVALSIYNFFQIVKPVWGRVIFVILILILPLRSDFYILTDIARAPIPKLDLEQLINGWPAGGGVKESIAFFEKESEKGRIMLGTQGTFGLMPAAYEIYLHDNPNIRINGLWPVESDELPLILIEESMNVPTYFVFYQPCPECDFPGDAPDGLKLIEVASFKKGIGEARLTIYQVFPEKK